MAADGREKNDGAWAKKADEHRIDFERAKGTGAPKALSVLLWVLGIAFEFFGVLVVANKIDLPIADPLKWVILIVCVIVAAALSFIATRIWSKAAKEAGQRGTSTVAVALSTAAFVPMVVFFTLSRNATTATKAASWISALVVVAAIIVACVLL